LSVERSALKVESSAPRGAVFLSYASQDADAARRIAQALRAEGVEVWFDESALAGGEAWDASIRKQISECALFVAIISASTQARREGYFRLEWRLAAQRTHMMSEHAAFVLPVVIDATRDAAADVPGEFKAVQWTRLPGGEANAVFCERVKQLLGGDVTARLAGPSPVLARSAAATPGPRRRAVPALIGLAALAGIGFAFWQPWKRPAPAAVVAASAQQAVTPPPTESTLAPLVHSIAVLPFANMSADKENTEYLSDGISEEILNALDRIPTLRVTPRTSSFSYKGKNVALDEIGRALRVSSVIEGSVRTAGNKVRATVKLLNAADGVRIWSEDFEFEMTDIFALQSEIAAKVAQKLGGGATAAVPAAAAPTKSLAAYDAYLRGRSAQLKGASPALVQEALRHYEEAVHLDPDFALAWARLAQGYRLAWWENDPSQENAHKARNAATIAQKLNPNLPEANLARAENLFRIDFDLDAAQHELERVGRLRPDDAEVLVLRALLEFARGNWGENFVSLARQSAERDPQNHYHVFTTGSMLATSGYFAEADAFFDRAWADRNFPGPIRMKAQFQTSWTGDIAAALSLLETCPEGIRNQYFYETRAELITLGGQAAAAIAAWEHVRVVAQRLEPSFDRERLPARASYQMGWLHARSGHLLRAEELYSESLARSENLVSNYPEDWSIRFYIAMIHARRSQKAIALAAAEQARRLALRTRDAWTIVWARPLHAEVFAALGQTDDAIAELRTVHEMGFAFGYTLRLDPRWESLRPHLKFQQLMKEAEARADAQPRPKR
jgi:TolB-like protein